jgi:hypothetical protein
MAEPRQQPTAGEDEIFPTEWALFDANEHADEQEPHRSGDAPLAANRRCKVVVPVRGVPGHPGIGRQPQLGGSAPCGQQLGELIRG